MELVIGGVYEIVSSIGTRYVVRIKDANTIKYDVVVLKDGNDDYSGCLMKDGSLLRNGTITRLDTTLDTIIEKQVKSRKKNQPNEDELFIESLIQHVQSRVTKEHIMRAIDEALDAGNRNLFMVLSNQLNELEGVTA